MPRSICEGARFEGGFGIDAGTLARTRQPARGPELKTATPALILSFDDGPEPVAALTSILRTLDHSHIKTEFYVLGERVQRSPDAARAIVKQGHKIYNHSWDHPKNLRKQSMAQVRAQLENTQKIIKEATGETPTKFRPPYGLGVLPGTQDPEITAVARALSLTIQGWDIDTNDWNNRPEFGGKRGLLVPEKLKKIREQLGWGFNKTKPKLNMLMHVLDETAHDLPGFITKLREWGYSFTDP